MAEEAEKKREAQNEMLEELQGEAARLKAEISLRDAEIADLRKEVRAYRKQHLEAYGKYLEGQREDLNSKGARWQRYMVAFTLGMVSIMVLTVMTMVLL